MGQNSDLIVLALVIFQISGEETFLMFFQVFVGVEQTTAVYNLWSIDKYKINAYLSVANHNTIECACVVH